jgi:vacuolar-type H+-ATPase subunit H
MSRKPPPSADTAVDEAIGRVLAAERAARDDVVNAASESAAIVDRAREAARAIAERTERRMNSVRRNFAARAAREIADIDAEATAQDAVRSLSTEDLVRLERAVAALCADLTAGLR